jgi:HEPN domain-containing protein
VGEAVDETVEVARRLENRAALERQTDAYFEGLAPDAAIEEADLENVLSAGAHEIDFDRP